MLSNNDRQRRSSSVKLLLEENGTITTEKKVKPSNILTSLIPSWETIIIIFGIYIFFIPFGYYQEHLYKFKSGDDVFYYPVFFTLTLLSSNTFTAWIILYFRHRNVKFENFNIFNKKRKASIKTDESDQLDKETSVISKSDSTEIEDSNHFFKIYVSGLNYSILREIYYIAFTYSLSIISTSVALNHVNYPTQVLLKSAKTVPVILGCRLFFKKKFYIFDYLTVILVTISLVIFNLQNSHSSSKNTTPIGIILLCISLLCDSITGPRQDRMNQQHKLSSIHVMFLVNGFAVLLVFIVCLIFESPHMSTAFLVKHPIVAFYLLAASLTHSLGQTFIFWALTAKGSLQLTLITTTRKCFSVLVSVVAFNHKVNLTQWICIFVVFIALGLQSVMKEMNKNNPNALKI